MQADDADVIVILGGDPNPPRTCGACGCALPEDHPDDLEHDVCDDCAVFLEG